ncbi:MAG: ATP-grasp domain-containing protein [Dehalococcoidia bacterium]
MTRIVLATCNLWPDLGASDCLYAEALEARGAQVTAAPWNGPQGQFRAADLVVLRSNWDYHYEPAAFALWLELLTRAGTTVLNPPEMALWNMHKRYLLTLGEHGVRVPQTFEVDYESASIRGALQDLGGETAVLKPAIGASGFHVYKATRRNLDEVVARVQAGLPDRPLLAQEFLPEIAEGERSFVFIDGQFCHLLRRQPDVSRRLDHDGDEPEFRANGTHGVTTTLAEAEPGAIAQARAVLDVLPAILDMAEPPLYARVDGVFRNGQLILTELELNEPWLGMNLHPPTAERFADATLRRLDR